MWYRQRLLGWGNNKNLKKKLKSTVRNQKKISLIYYLGTTYTSLTTEINLVIKFPITTRDGISENRYIWKVNNISAL